MKVKYFSDTDTAHIEFTDRGVHETKEISENIYIDVRRRRKWRYREYDN
jgi:uncharacterized protein YuzE